MSNPATNNKHFIDIVIDNFTRAIQQLIESTLFILTRKNTSNKIPPDIQYEITIKNRLRHKWQRTRDPATKRLLKSKIIFIQTILQTHKQNQ